MMSRYKHVIVGSKQIKKKTLLPKMRSKVKCCITYSDKSSVKYKYTKYEPYVPTNIAKNIGRLNILVKHMNLLVTTNMRLVKTDMLKVHMSVEKPNYSIIEFLKASLQI